MRYHVLAADFDGTIAHHGKVDAATWSALHALRESGRKVILVTGRELEQLLRLIPRPEIFDRIVAENGALIYEPASREIQTVAPGPPAVLVAELERRGVDRISVGHVIVALWEPHQDTALSVIRDLGLELQVIFNKGAVMILPSGVNKATGLAEALAALGLSRHNVVAVGDAENDHALLAASECGVAVANALPALKRSADFVTDGDHGKGVRELIAHLINNDLAVTTTRLKRHYVRLGRHHDHEIAIDPYRANVMICGTSGSGKSTITAGLLERMHIAGYQFAIVDPEGDYTALDFAVTLGSSVRAPLIDEVLDVLAHPTDNVVANLLGVAVEHRPEVYAELAPALADLRARTGRPHWLVVDEAHHLVPAAWKPAGELPIRSRGTLYITVHPRSVTPSLLATFDTVIAVGERPDETLRELCEVARLDPPPRSGIEKLPAGHVLYWHIGSDPVEVITEKPRGERTRHSRKYSEGNLGPERSFYFRGEHNKLNLRAYNLVVFLQLGDGVDDETWSFHLAAGDYSRWMRIAVKDDELAAAVAEIERQRAGSPAESRALIRAEIEKRYTLPADRPSGVIDRPAHA